MAVDDFTLARVIHVLAVLAWIGGVWFVTFTVFPAIGRNEAGADRLAAFHRIEGRFAPQARWYVTIAGLSGFWMTWRMDLWSRFTEARYWWMHAMVALWLIFTVMLFIAEPLVIHRRMANSPDPARDFARMQRMHRVLSVAAIITVAGAVGGAHGLF